MNSTRTAIVVALAIGLAGGAQAASASSGSPATAIVSIGDSFISGEGGRWMGNGTDPLGTRSGTDRAAFDCGGWGCEYDPHRVYGASEDNDCHRSDVAPIRSAPVVVAEKVNLACSGAKLENVRRASSGGRPHFGEAPQADQLARVARRGDVRMIVLTVGANDVGFGGLVADCALDWARSSPAEPDFCRGGAQADLEVALPGMAAGLRGALRDVRAAMATAGYRRSDYRLVVMGYASPFPPGVQFRYPEDGWSRLTEGGCPLWNADANWATRRATPAIDAVMRASAHREGAEYLDIQHAFDGRQLCDRRSVRVGATGPNPRTAEWFRRLGFSQGSPRESLHPNAYGQRAIGACIALAYAADPGDHACRDTPGRSYVDGMRLVAFRSAD